MTRAARAWSGFTAWARARAGSELRWILVPLVILLGVWGFAEIADEVVEGSTRRFDEAALQALREPGDPSDPLGPPWLAHAARDITALGSWPVLALLTLAVLGFLLLEGAWHAATLVLVACAGGALLSHLLKGIFQRPRPGLVPHLDEVVTYSFPSGHAMFSAAVYLTLGLLLARLVSRRRLKVYALAVAATATGLVGVSRVFVGVHYPTDVVAGWLGGLSWAAACWLVALVLQRRGAVEEAVETGEVERPEAAAVR